MNFKKRLVLAALVLLGLFLFYRQNYEVPILMYHHIADEVRGSSEYVRLETFERQMEFLKVHQYRVLSLQEYVELIQSRKPLPWKAVVITFDDGNLDNAVNAFPILKKMHFRATIFMITKNINAKGSLSEEDLKILDGSGIAIGSHTEHHAYLPELKIDEVIAELRHSRNTLEKILGHPVFLFSYPAGGFTPEIRALVESEGYKAALTTNRGRARLDPYALRRIKITDDGGGLFSFWWKVGGLYQVTKFKRKCSQISRSSTPAKPHGEVVTE